MKKVVWKNKSNNQLCITIPKDSGLKEGDLVEVKKNTIKHIAYSGVVGDLFHYGHLQSLQYAKSIADYNIAGVFTDEAVEEYRAKPICNYQERKAIFQNLHCVDRVMLQSTKDSTENLKKIHEEFPDAEIILVHGDDLDDVPGAEYVKSIGGKTVKHPYYARLSNFKIMNELAERRGKLKDITDFSSLITEGSPEIKNKIIVSSKADTLKALQPLLKKSRIEPLYSFTISDWKNDRGRVISSIVKQFSPHPIVIRSSAMLEDTFDKSLAGHFTSLLNIPAEKAAIEEAIRKVLQSYKEKNAETSFNQVLVQKQTEDLLLSGVVFTRTLHHNAPYYVLNYDDTTGSTDSVTAGREHQSIIISRTLPSTAAEIPSRIQPIITAVQEIEALIPSIPLDIEFALAKNKEVVIFQVRPLAANISKEQQDESIQQKRDELKKKFKSLAAPQNHLAGETTFFGDMPDWNPAEIIGDQPNHLDYSLYDYLITHSAWHEARTSQGYYNVNPARLIELFGSKPYVNVRNTFNSFAPAAISDSLRQKLLSFCLQKLRQNPHLQDKVEFEILYTCYDLSFDQRSQELLEAGFSGQEILELKTALQELTNTLLINSSQNIAEDMQAVHSLEEFRQVIRQKVAKEQPTPKELINYCKILLDECRKKGTVQFSRLARLGFIGKTILKSVVAAGILSSGQYGQFYNSISTVATQISADFKKLLQGKATAEEFLAQYYHLRPGTYDITSLRYDMNSQLLQNLPLASTSSFTLAEDTKGEFRLDERTKEKITAAFRQAGLHCIAEEFFHFIGQATQARESSKFEFTKNLSEALELLAKAGEEMGFTRKEIAQLDINDIFRINISDSTETIQQWKTLIKRQEQEQQIHDKLVLPALLFSEQDFDVVQPYQAKPNFITQKAVESRIINLNELHDHQIPDLEGSIVVLENGDPGYDWIFTRRIAGLITKYGGVASHMSIRCAEFGLPAAIGCGELIFNQVKSAEKVLLDCKANRIIPLVLPEED